MTRTRAALSLLLSQVLDDADAAAYRLVRAALGARACDRLGHVVTDVQHARKAMGRQVYDVSTGTCADCAAAMQRDPDGTWRARRPAAAEAPTSTTEARP